MSYASMGVTVRIAAKMNKRRHGPLGFFQPTPHSLRRNGAQIGTQDVANCPWSMHMGTHQERVMWETH